MSATGLLTKRHSYPLSLTSDYSLDEIVFHAHKVREATEYYVFDIIGNRYSYQDLSCYCAITSTTFSWYAWFRMGIKVNLYEGVYLDAWHITNDDGEPSDSNHCWNVYNDHIIDLTATQFGVKEKVYITNKDDAAYQAFFEDVPFIERSKMNKHFNDWTPQQRPSVSIIKGILNYVA